MPQVTAYHNNTKTPYIADNRDIVFIGSTRGHRPSYLSTFSKILAFTPIAGTASFKWFLRLLGARKLCLATIDDNVPYYMGLMLTRALLGKRTVGITVRPQALFYPPTPWKGISKKVLFKTLKKWSSVRVVSILPPSALPGIDRILNHWIVDPELWDLWMSGSLPELPDTELSQRIQTKSESKKIILTVGGVSPRKDIAGLVDFVLGNEDYFLVAGGIVFPEYEALAREVATHPRVYLENRWLEQREILSLYKIADYAWCRYGMEEHASSGVFGRAIQTGVMPIIKEGTSMERLSKMLKVPYALLHDIPDYAKGEAGKDMSAIAEQNMRTIISLFN